MLSFETEPHFRVGEEVGLFEGHIELGSGQVVSFTPPQKLVM